MKKAHLIQTAILLLCLLFGTYHITRRLDIVDKTTTITSFIPAFLSRVLTLENVLTLTFFSGILFLFERKKELRRISFLILIVALIIFAQEFFARWHSAVPMEWKYYTTIKYFSYNGEFIQDPFYNADEWLHPPYFNVILLGNIAGFFGRLTPIEIMGVLGFFKILEMVFTVMLVYLTVKELFDKETGLYASLFVSLFPTGSGWFVIYQFVWVYALSGLFLLIKYLKTKESKFLYLSIIPFLIGIMCSSQQPLWLLLPSWCYLITSALFRQRKIRKDELYFMCLTFLGVLAVTAMWYPPTSSFFQKSSMPAWSGTGHPIWIAAELLIYGLLLFISFMCYSIADLKKEGVYFIFSFQALLLFLLIFSFTVQEVLPIFRIITVFWSKFLSTVFILVPMITIIPYALLRGKRKAWYLLLIFCLGLPENILFAHNLSVRVDYPDDVIFWNRARMSQADYQAIDLHIPSGSYVVTDTYTGYSLTFWTETFPVSVGRYDSFLELEKQRGREGAVANVLNESKTLEQAVSSMLEYNSSHVVINKMMFEEREYDNLLFTPLYGSYNIEERFETFEKLYESEGVLIYRLAG